MAQKLAKCPDCGYTEQDAKLHLDHYLCKNSGNAPWEKKSEPRTPAAPETAPDAAQQAAYKILRTVGTPSYVDDEQYNRDMAIAEGRIRVYILKFMGPFLTLRAETARKEEV